MIKSRLGNKISQQDIIQQFNLDEFEPSDINQELANAQYRASQLDIHAITLFENIIQNSIQSYPLTYNQTIFEIVIHQLAEMAKQFAKIKDFNSSNYVLSIIIVWCKINYSTINQYFNSLNRELQYPEFIKYLNCEHEFKFQVLNNVATIFLYIQQYELCESTIIHILEFSFIQNITNPLLIGTSFLILSQQKYQQKDYRNSLSNSFNCIIQIQQAILSNHPKNFEMEKLIKIVCDCYINLGKTYYFLGNSKKTEINFSLALKYANKYLIQNDIDQYSNIHKIFLSQEKEKRVIPQNMVQEIKNQQQFEFKKYPNPLFSKPNIQIEAQKMFVNNKINKIQQVDSNQINNKIISQQNQFNTILQQQKQQQIKDEQYIFKNIYAQIQKHKAIISLYWINQTSAQLCVQSQSITFIHEFEIKAPSSDVNKFFLLLKTNITPIVNLDYQKKIISFNGQIFLNTLNQANLQFELISQSKSTIFPITKQNVVNSNCQESNKDQSPRLNNKSMKKLRRISHSIHDEGEFQRKGIQDNQLYNLFNKPISISDKQNNINNSIHSNCEKRNTHSSDEKLKLQEINTSQ